MTFDDAAVVTIAHGQRLAVVSDLDLSENSTATDEAVTALVRLLRDGDDALTLVVAGNFFRPLAHTGLAETITRVFTAIPTLASALRDFASRPNSTVYALPGVHDATVDQDERAQHALAAVGVHVAPSVLAWVDTLTGMRAVRVVAGESVLDLDAVNEPDRFDADRLDSPDELTAFLSSRSLYRRYAAWVWLPIIALAGGFIFDLLGIITTHWTHHRVGFWRHHHFHLLGKAHGAWTNIITVLIAFAFLEALIAIFAGWQVNRRFGHRASTVLDALGHTTVGGVPAMDIARDVASGGGLGLIVGGARTAATTFFDRGICASPGPSRDVTTRLSSRFGLPSVFARAPISGVVEVVAGSSAHLRLSVRESVARGATRLERLVSLPGTAHDLDTHPTVVSAWPTGNPWPPSPTDSSQLTSRRKSRQLVSYVLFATGLLNVIAALTPPLHSRLQDLLTVVPLGVAQSAQAITAIAGVGLVMLARSLRRGQRYAWRSASGILAVTVFTHLVRGEAIASTLIALGVLILLIVRRHDFEATGEGQGVRRWGSRVAAVALLGVVTSVISVEAASSRHALPSLWRVFEACTQRLIGIDSIALPDRVNDFVAPSLLSLGIVLIIIALYGITRPVVDRRLSQQATSRERRLSELRARDIVRRYGRGTLDYFALRDDKQFFFFRDSVVAYAVYGGVALISPDPIGPVTDRTDVFAAFRDFAESRGWTTAIVGAGEEWLAVYRSAGYHQLYIGDEALVDCTTFSLEGGKMKGLRQAVGRLAKKGYRVEFIDPAKIDPAKVPPLLELIAMLRRGDGERGFSMSLGRLFYEKDQGLLLTVVYGPDGSPVACCQFVPTPASAGYSLDLMRRDPGEHPNGLIDFALCETIRHLGERGVTRLSLNFAAFRSVLDGEKGDGMWMKVERWALRRLSGILPIESLWSFNNKYQPTWNPRYLLYPAVESFVPVVAAVLRAESLTEIPVIGRLLANDPSNRPATVVPDDVLERAGATAPDA